MSRDDLVRRGLFRIVVGEIPVPFCQDNSGFVIRSAPARMVSIESHSRIVMSSISSPGVIQGFRRHGDVTTAVTRLEVRLPVEHLYQREPSSDLVN